MGTGAAGVGGAYYLGAFEGGGKGTPGPSIQETLKQYTTPEEVKKNNGGHCIEAFNRSNPKNNWEENGTIAKATNLTSVSQTSDAKLDDPATPTKGCLVISWNKQKADGDKWSGNFQLEWTLFSSTKGFAVYLMGQTKDDNSMQFEGVSYVFKKDNEKWKTTHKLDAQKKDLSSSDVASKFPKRGTGFKDDSVVGDSSDTSRDYWGFLDSTGKLNTTHITSSPRKRTWTSNATGQTGTAVELAKWSSNLGDWWDHFFGKSKWDMSAVIKEVNGYWNWRAP